MYPFFVLGVAHDATDADVERAYREQVTRFPPDRAPDEFAAVRRAYEQLRTERARVTTRLAYYDETGRSAQTDLCTWLERAPQRRLSMEDIAKLSEQVLGHVG